MKEQYLYGLTVQGIQSYIFETNKLKEIIGASEIIEQICTTEFNDFVKGFSNEGKSTLQAAGNIRYITNKKNAKRIFEDFHFQLLEKYPNVPFSQAVVKIEDNDVKNALKELDVKLRGQRNKPTHYAPLGNMIRSKYYRTGSFTSNQIYPYNEDGESQNRNIDYTTHVKLKNWEGNILKKKFKLEDKYDIPTEFSELTKGGKDHWLALIHIDGNGMGNIINELLKDSESLVKDLSDFSKNVDCATKNAFQKAIDNTFINDQEIEKTLPFRPLVLGGDDVTVIMRADFALKFTKIFLTEFEKETKERKINDSNGLTSCAGIVYMKEKFPFHYAAHLAEELCVYAKDRSGRKASCLHFHKVQDSIFEDYKDIQKRELTATDITFSTEPYYLNEIKNNDETNADNEENQQTSTIYDLQNRIAELNEEDAPRNKIREWVDACFNNPRMAQEMQNRIDKFDKYLPNKKEAINYLTQLAIQKI